MTAIPTFFFLALAILHACCCRCDALQVFRRNNNQCMRNSFRLFTTGRDLSDPVLRLPFLESELATLPTSNDDGSHDADEVSAKRRQDIEEEISNARTAAEFGVRRAQVNYYEAFANSDYDAMEVVWSDEVHVRCIHPGMRAIEGKERVMISWALIFSQGGEFGINPSRVHVDISGQTAIVNCIEETPNGGTLEAVNVYRRENGNWRMTLHMASPILIRK